jgi:hypothetical protein
MSTADDMMDAPDANEAQHASNAVADPTAAGSKDRRKDPIMTQQEEAGQPSADPPAEAGEESILDRLRREDRVSLTPEQPLLGRRRRSSSGPPATPAAAPPTPPADGEESILDRLHREQSPAAAAEGESILDRLHREQSPAAAAAEEESILDRLHREQSPAAPSKDGSVLDRLEQSPAAAEGKALLEESPAPPTDEAKPARQGETNVAGFQYVYARAAPPAPPALRGPRRVTCYMCGLEAGTKSIRFHHEKCAARWPATEARPLPPAVTIPPGGAALAAYNRKAAAAYAAHSKRAFAPASLRDLLLFTHATSTPSPRAPINRAGARSAGSFCTRRPRPRARSPTSSGTTCATSARTAAATGPRRRRSRGPADGRAPSGRRPRRT